MPGWAEKQVGTWYNEDSGEWSEGGKKYYDKTYNIITFNSDGTGTYRFYRWDSRDGVYENTWQFVYTIISDLGDHGVVRRTYTTGDKNVFEDVYSIAGNILTLDNKSYQKGYPSI